MIGWIRIWIGIWIFKLTTMGHQSFARKGMKTKTTDPIRIVLIPMGLIHLKEDLDPCI
jgi:hypothetical protein